MSNMRRLFEEIVTLYEEDYSVRDISNYLGLSEETIMTAIEFIKSLEEEA